ncbi:hypothetical protein, partial [Ideonella sp.]|uniref:hypothetical protein n=1 Tax=Ideonella sp. TaxID=1929293 RepID=UPI003BB6C36C
MKFENRAPAEGINARPESLSREAFWLVAGSVLALVVLVASFDVLARWLAPRLPFSVELKLAESMEREGPVPAPELRAAQADLQALALRLREPLGMPDDMPVQIRLD